MRRHRTPASTDITILDSLGHEIVGVMSPVSICMLLVVLLVSSLSPSSIDSSSSPPLTVATLFYLEPPSDPPSKKLLGALLNAAAFVSLVAAATFLLAILYRRNLTAFLKSYTRLSALFALASMGGSILLSFLRRFSLPLDAPSAILLLLNFSSVGAISLFSPAVPILLRQSYTVSLATIVAAWLTKLPEWTTWALLLALAAYDLAAVLCPLGPLRILVDLAASRGEDLPALVYESRPAAPDVDLELHPINANSAERDDVFETRRGIRLGLGDFVFYSVLVGRAAMFDLMTVYACYLAIVSGLGCTLILLSVCRRALPALPISIGLGVAFYFLTRLVMEAFVVGAATSLVMF